MKYSRSDITQLVQLAFKGIRNDAALQQELSLTEQDIQQREATLLSSDVLDALEILFNAVYPQGEPLSKKELLFQTAEKYSLETLQLSTRAYNILTRCEVRTVADLLSISEKRLKKIRGLGATSQGFGEIKEKMNQFIQDFYAGRIQ